MSQVLLHLMKYEFANRFPHTVTKSQVGGMYRLPEVRSPTMFRNKFKCGLQEIKEFILEKG